MRTTLLILLALAACGRPDAEPPPDASSVDAPPPYDPPPQVGPCAALDFPTPLIPLTEQILAAADVDGDGQPDLITATPSTIGFYRGLGAGGRFAPEVVSSLGPAPPYFPNAATVADLDGDGKLDLVVYVGEPISLLVMRGDGAGAFQPAANYPSNSPYGYGSVVAGDFNGDGRPDIAYVADGFPNTANLRLNSGDGTLGAETAIAVASSLAITDIDGDGALDVIVLNDSTLGILRGNGDGTFTPGSVLATVQSPRQVAVSDLNADGHPDVILAGVSSDGVTGWISVHVNDGTGALLAHVDYQAPLFDHGVPFVIGDLDQDGKLDVVTANLVLLGGKGDGSLKPATQTHLIDDGMEPIAMRDWNGDGEPDVLFGHTSVLGLLESNHRGGYNTRVHYDMGENANSVAAYDFNHDGYIDVVVSGSDIRIALGKPGGLFGNPKTISTHGGSPVVTMTVGDFNGDQIADLVVWRVASLTVLLGKGDGSFRDPAPDLTLRPVDIVDVPFALGDLDGDGKTDIVVGDGSGLSVFLSHGDGTFNQVVLDASVAFRVFRTVSVTDLNGDGLADVVASSCTPNAEGPGCAPPAATDVWLNLGNGTFSVVAVDTTALPFFVADLDGDGKLDLFRGSTLRHGNGDGTFQPEVPTGIPSQVSGSRLRDINSDGKLDYVVLDSAGRLPVTVYQGVGDGTFAAPTAYYGLTGAGQIADIDHDGRPDIIIPVQGNTFDVMFARCP